jgi:2-methylisocitrate lyase-like PEP mutase family enzyme
VKAHVAPLREQIATLKATAEARHRLHINTHEALELQTSRVDTLEREAVAADAATTELFLDATQLRDRIRELTKVVATNERRVNTLFKTDLQRRSTRSSRLRRC